jgi:NAD(P)H-nitrite reductase large subunit
MGCIETLKKFGYSGEITVVTRELTYPYDKTKLSKDIKNIDYDKILLRDQDWYKSNGI